jgi:hypothetical protein
VRGDRRRAQPRPATGAGRDARTRVPVAPVVLAEPGAAPGMGPRRLPRLFVRRTVHGHIRGRLAAPAGPGCRPRRIAGALRDLGVPL